MDINKNNYSNIKKKLVQHPSGKLKKACYLTTR